MDELGAVFTTADSPEKITTEIYSVESDRPGRLRLVTKASVCDRNSYREVAVEPYLLVFWNGEGKVNTCFVRTDVVLAHG